MTKDFMVQHATQTFLANGYKTVTMDEVAADLGVSKKTLYEIFDNKVGLIKATLEFQFHEIRAIFAEMKAQNLNALAELHFIVEKIRQKVSSPQHKNSVYQLQKYYAKIYRKIYMEQVKYIQVALHENIIKGQKDGLYRTDIDALGLSELLIQVQGFFRSNEKPLTDLEKMEELSMIHLDLMLRGITTDLGLKIYNQLETSLNEK